MGNKVSPSFEKGVERETVISFILTPKTPNLCHIEKVYLPDGKK